MAWRAEFLDKIRKWWLRKVVRAEYYSSTTNSWYEGDISEKHLSGNTITFKIQTTDTLNLTISKLRLVDDDGIIAYEGNRTIVKSANEGALIQIDVPIIEE